MIMFRIEGKSDLVKDPTTGSVINTNHESLKEAKKLKIKMLNSIKKQESLENRINRLEELVNKLTEGK